MRSIRILIGTGLTMAGAVWLTDRLGGVPELVPFLVRWSPVILIVLGGLEVLAILRRSRLLAPVAMLAVGFGALLAIDGSLSDATGPRFWPSTALVVGLVVALYERDRRHSDEPILRATAILRTRTVARSRREFVVGKVRTVLGSMEVDLTMCELGANAELQLSIWLGHVRLVVPDGYQVDLQAEHAVAIDVPTLPPSDPNGGVVIAISVLGFGGAVELTRAWTQHVAELDDEEGEEGAEVTAPTSALPA